MKHFICVLIVLCFSLQAVGQKVSVSGGFFSDSVGIGEQTRYYLAVHYPSKLNVLFPDSTYDFKPFEFENKRYFPTVTTDSLSYDSVVYFLSTFEVDSIQYLSVPVFVLNKKDSTLFAPAGDSIKLNQLVRHVPDSLSPDKLPLKANTAYQKVHFLFNYPVLIIVAGALLILTLIIVLVFGKRLRKYFRLKRLRKNHQKFIAVYTKNLAEVKTGFSASITEITLTSWKKYMEQLIGWPYTKLTTRETSLLEKDENLGSSLRLIDKAIYGHDTDVLGSLINLRDYAEQKFLKKFEEVKHGK